MIIHCTGCQKALEVDEHQFTRDRMRGVCPGCQTIIEVARPQTDPGAGDVPPEAVRKETVTPKATQAVRRFPGLNISQKLQVLFLSFILITGGVVTFLYLSFVPAMMNDQIRLRTVPLPRRSAALLSSPFWLKTTSRSTRPQ